MKILHVIVGLNDGGAEGVLYRLCAELSEHEHTVVALQTGGKYEPLLSEAGIAVYTLNMARGRPSITAFIKLFGLIREVRPDVVQTWMYHADLYGGLAARLAGVKKVFWGLRHSTLEAGEAKMTTIWIAKLLGKLSRKVPTRIVVCAKSCIDGHERLGYEYHKMHLIPNGYNLTDFEPKPASAQALRASLGIPSKIALVGMVGRYHPLKDHANLLEALVILCSRGIPIMCLFVGEALDSKNVALARMIEDLGVEDLVVLMGRRSDVPEFMSTLDLHILSSAGEAFPNVVAEAMACGTPNVVTDVGDAAYIVGDTGWVVPPHNAEALADAIEIALHERTKPEWAARCEAARQRIVDNFSLNQMTAAYNQLWYGKYD